MIRHVVSLQLASSETRDRRKYALEIRRRLEALLDVTEGVEAINVYFDIGDVATHWPVILVVDCATTQSLAAYQAHPRHRAVVKWMNEGIVSDRAIVDFELPRK